MVAGQLISSAVGLGSGAPNPSLGGGHMSFHADIRIARESVSLALFTLAISSLRSALGLVGGAVSGDV